MADPYYDPYKYTRDIQALNAQQKALGQARSLSPQALTGIIGANFRVRQEEEERAREVALAERQQALNEQVATAQLKQQRQANIAGAVSGAAQIALYAPSAIKGYQDIGWMDKPGALADQINTTETTAKALQGFGTGTPATPLTGDVAAEFGGYAKIPDLSTIGQTEVTKQAATSALPPPTPGAQALTGAGYGALGYMAGRSLVRGKESPWAGVLGSTAAGAAAGPWGAATGFAVGVASNLFGGSWKL